MAKSKVELLDEAQMLELEVTEKNTVKEISEALKKAKAERLNSNKKPEAKVAKAGKRSAKALREQEEIAAKEARKQARAESEEEKKKTPQKPTRSRLERRSKAYKNVETLREKGKLYTIKDAVGLAQKMSTVAFDSTVELHIRLNVDPRQADQNIRDSVVLPAGTGKKIRVAVFADPDMVKVGQEAGADIALADEFLELLNKEEIAFDVLIATPEMMPKLAKYARLLGPKGLMPNPKSGTVTKEIGKAVREAQSGKIEYRVDESGIVHIAIGKVSFSTEGLIENARAIFSSIKGNKPASIKGAFVKSCYITTSMGPSVAIDPNEF